MQGLLLPLKVTLPQVIAEMIEELTQLEGTKVSKISVEETPSSASGVTGGSSHFKDLPSSTPRIGDISAFDTLTLSIETDIVVMTAGDVAPTQEE